MNTAPTRRLHLWMAVLATAWSLCLPLFGDETTDLLGKAINLVHQASDFTANPSGNDLRVQQLTQAIQLAQQAPEHRLKGHRVLAIQDLRSAIAEIQKNDPDHKATAFLHEAESELNSALSLAQTIHPLSTSPPSVPSPATTLSSAPVVSAPVVAENSETTPSAGITPEMEQSFLARYKSALEKQDPDAYLALFALDPAMDAKEMEEFKPWALLGPALAASNPNRTYSFVPVPSDAENKTTVSNGKVYGNNLPPVIAFKITFGQPPQPTSGIAVGETVIPLCVRDHQLMIVGPREIPGAVPPPEKKRYNFGLTPNIRKPNEKVDDPLRFASLEDFLSSLKQPRVEVLASGKNALVYYAVCRVTPNLCVYADSNRTDQDDTFVVEALDSNQQKLISDPTWIYLVDIPTDNGSAPSVQGIVYKVPDTYTGSITVKCHYRDAAGKDIQTVSQTIDWKK